MANITRITVYRDAKINLGDYESASMGVTLTAEVEKDEDAGAAYMELSGKVKKALAMEVAQVTRNDARRWVGEVIGED
jgi:hypothetical protein